MNRCCRTPEGDVVAAAYGEVKHAQGAMQMKVNVNVSFLKLGSVNVCRGSRASRKLVVRSLNGITNS